MATLNSDILGRRSQDLSIEQRHELAAFLTDALGGELRVTYSPEAVVDGAEQETRGLVYRVQTGKTEDGIEIPMDWVVNVAESDGDVAWAVIHFVDDIAAMYTQLTWRVMDALDPYWIRSEPAAGSR